VPGSEQIPADVFTGPDQIAGGFLSDAGHRHRDDLVQMQQSGQMPGVAAVGLDPVT
jgi:hypothetical protein